MCGTCGCTETAAPERTLVDVEVDVLAKNDRIAADNRRWLAERRVLSVNVMSSPGSGKTTLLERTARDLAGQVPICVVEGDQATHLDADRIRAAGVPVVQVNTGSGCHLDAGMLGHELRHLDPVPGSVLFIENVGNLVCPALFDLGEGERAVIMSVTEGPDKPLKYPHMFASAELLLLNKVDLLPHLDFDVAALLRDVELVNPRMQTLLVSAVTGEGLERWYAWVAERRPVAGPAEAVRP